MHALSKLPPPLAATTHPWGNRNTAYKCRALPPCPAKCLLKFIRLGIIIVKEESITSALQLQNLKMCRFPSCTILSQQTIRANSLRHLFKVGDWMRDNHMNANLVPQQVSWCRFLFVEDYPKVLKCVGLHIASMSVWVGGIVLFVLSCIGVVDFNESHRRHFKIFSRRNRRCLLQ